MLDINKIVKSLEANANCAEAEGNRLVPVGVGRLSALVAAYKAQAKQLAAKDAEIEKLRTGGHCVDCCCARSWAALGVTENTGKSIPEHITGIRASLTAADALRDRLSQKVFSCCGSCKRCVSDKALIAAYTATRTADPAEGRGGGDA